MIRATVDTDTLCTDDMHVACPRAARLDVHKMHITATVRLCEAGSGPARTATREFSALPDGLRAMTDWLRGHSVTAAAMEGTGVYWKAPFEALEDAGIHADLLNAQHVKQIVGRTYRAAARTCETQIGNETAAVREALRSFADLGRALLGARDTGAALDAVIANRPGWEGLGDLVATAAALAKWSRLLRTQSRHRRADLDDGARIAARSITVYNLNSRSLLALEDFDTNAVTNLPAGHPYAGLDRSQVYTELDFTVNGRLPRGRDGVRGLDGPADDERGLRFARRPELVPLLQPRRRPGRRERSRDRHALPARVGWNCRRTSSTC